MTPPPATLTEGSVGGQLVSLTVPMIWGIAALMSLNVVDTWFVAQLGEQELAAMSFTFPVTFTLVSLGIGLMAGTASVISRVLGCGDLDRVRRLITDASVLGTILALANILSGAAAWLWFRRVCRGYGAGAAGGEATGTST